MRELVSRLSLTWMQLAYLEGQAPEALGCNISEAPVVPEAGLGARSRAPDRRGRRNPEVSEVSGRIDGSWAVAGGTWRTLGGPRNPSWP